MDGPEQLPPEIWGIVVAFFDVDSAEGADALKACSVVCSWFREIVFREISSYSLAQCYDEGMFIDTLGLLDKYCKNSLKALDFSACEDLDNNVWAYFSKLDLFSNILTLNFAFCVRLKRIKLPPNLTKLTISKSNTSIIDQDSFPQPCLLRCLGIFRQFNLPHVVQLPLAIQQLKIDSTKPLQRSANAWVFPKGLQVLSLERMITYNWNFIFPAGLVELILDFVVTSSIETIVTTLNTCCPNLLRLSMSGLRTFNDSPPATNTISLPKHLQILRIPCSVAEHTPELPRTLHSLQVERLGNRKFDEVCAYLPNLSLFVLPHHEYKLYGRNETKTLKITDNPAKITSKFWSYANF
eukprot:TRINITY_DN7702_c0_g1_i1.p1 TRINITY_DN7702_c0_g1~~TRINITY_DN7702_c0_g1_i1.p1  ORF type:complete len:368 (+),score=24.51 TRINITY_DN7702_c0_g1_i1:46-1104(+)